ncbi:MAG: sulfate adenylyltransferase [Arcobacter sp.]|nr:MAG: sulfate adenylyltransferase [Arcobacter sp.]
MIKILIILFCFSSLSQASFIKTLGLTSSDIKNIKTDKNKKYIFNRLLSFKRLKYELKKEKNKEIILTRVNNFFNKIEALADLKNYRKIDYWASRKEFLIRGKGDCEDYVIAKYFTLLELGFKPKDFSLLQVEYKKQLHLVLTYKNNKEKIVLDNINKKIVNINERNDLAVLYEIQSLDFKAFKNKKITHLLAFKWNELLQRLEN